MAQHCRIHPIDQQEAAVLSVAPRRRRFAAIGVRRSPDPVCRPRPTPVGPLGGPKRRQAPQVPHLERSVEGLAERDMRRCWMTASICVRPERCTGSSSSTTGASNRSGPAGARPHRRLPPPPPNGSCISRRCRPCPHCRMDQPARHEESRRSLTLRIRSVSSGLTGPDPGT